MPDEKQDPPDKPNLASVERTLFEALFGFHTKTITLLRNSSLDEGQKLLVADRIKTLYADIAAQIQPLKDFDLESRLDAAYEEVEQLVEKLSTPHESSDNG